MKETIIVLGYDGYIGNALTQKLLAEKYKVIGIDNYIKRTLVSEVMESCSAIPYIDKQIKIEEFKLIGNFIEKDIDVSDGYEELKKLIKTYNPTTIVNLAHNPSAAFSMINRDSSRYVLKNNILGINDVLWAIKETDPEIHLINIGTTGEYDHCSNVDISEGYFKFIDNGRESSEMIFPRRPGSIYHSSKVAMTYIIDYLCKSWDLKCTDIMQGIVVGSYTDEIKESKIYSPLHTDEAFGTVLNRFIVEAKLNVPLTIYGKGEHSRPFLSLNDSVQALMIAIKTIPDKGKVRVWNQLSSWLSINEMATTVKNVVEKEFNNNVTFSYIETPRKENVEKHYYNFKTDILKSLGYSPTITIEDEIKYTYGLLIDDNISKLKNKFIPNIKFTR